MCRFCTWIWMWLPSAGDRKLFHLRAASSVWSARPPRFILPGQVFMSHRKLSPLTCMDATGLSVFSWVVDFKESPPPRPPVGPFNQALGRAVVHHVGYAVHLVCPLWCVRVPPSLSLFRVRNRFHLCKKQVLHVLWFGAVLLYRGVFGLAWSKALTSWRDAPWKCSKIDCGDGSLNCLLQMGGSYGTWCPSKADVCTGAHHSPWFKIPLFAKQAHVLSINFRLWFHKPFHITLLTLCIF